MTTMPITCVDINEGALHINHSCEFICEPEINLQSRGMGQVLLPHVRGAPFWYLSEEGTLGGPLMVNGCIFTCCVFMWIPCKYLSC